MTNFDSRIDTYEHIYTVQRIQDALIPAELLPADGLQSCGQCGFRFRDLTFEDEVAVAGEREILPPFISFDGRCPRCGFDPYVEESAG